MYDRSASSPRTKRNNINRFAAVGLLLGSAFAAGLLIGIPTAESADDLALDPAAWGSDHVGKPLPMFTEGGECLFCHRTEAITQWEHNAHQRTMHLASDEPKALEALRAVEGLAAVVDDVWLILGAGEYGRFLKKSEHYGKVDILPALWHRNDDGGELTHTGSAEWDTEKFAQNCAGCHASGIDPEVQSFVAVAHDCFVCHGEVPTEHTAKPELALFAKNGIHDARTLTATCASCHIRTGTSRSTGRPYPNNFVPGDNVFRDFEVDFSDEAIAALNPHDAHVLMNVRDVVIRGMEEETCMTCHDVHNQSSEKHVLLKTRQDCYVCHQEGVRKSDVRVFDAHSAVCEY